MIRRHQQQGTVRRTAIAVAMLSLLTACATVPRDPITTMVDRETSGERRLRAAQLAAESQAQDPRRLAALETVLWSHGYTQEERVYALDELITYDEPRTRRRLARDTRHLPSIDILRAVYDRAAARGWEEFVPAAVRTWALPLAGMDDAVRPERDLLIALRPGASIEAVLAEVFRNASDTYTMADQVAAWEVMGRLLTAEALRKVLHEAATDTRSALVADLAVGWRDLAVLPRSREGVLWLMSLRVGAESWWREAQQRIAALDEPQREGLALRHLPLLVQADHVTPPDESTLRRSVRERLREAQVVRRNPAFLGGSTEDYPQTFEEVSDRLSWGDLLALSMLLDAMEDRSLHRTWFEQADADLVDTSTEYAGVLRWDDAGGLEALLFEPLIRRHNMKHYASPALIEACYTGLAHYHFHAQSYRNRDHAGPARGDLTFADSTGFNCIVLTFLSRDEMNVDFYREDGVIVDLGTIRRP